MTGYTTSDLPTAPLADELVVNRNGATARQRVADLSTQLAGSGPLAEEIAARASSADLQSVIDSLEQLQLDIGPIYATTSAGLAATVEGQQFRVESAAAEIAYSVYQHAGGAAVLKAQVPAAGVLTDKATTAELAETNARTAPLTKFGRAGLAGWAFPIRDAAGRVVAGLTGDLKWVAKALKIVAKPPTGVRGDDFGTPLAQDTSGRVAIGVRADGSTYIHRLADRTLESIARAVAGEIVPSGQRISGVPGYNHRGFDASRYLITMPTFFGPVDVLWPKSGAGIKFAATEVPVELCLQSGQSNTGDGGDDAHPYTLFKLMSDQHRAYMVSPQWMGSWYGSDAYASGDVTSLTPLNQDVEFNGGNVPSMFPYTFSRIALDQREQREQRVYVAGQIWEGGKPLTEWMPGTVKGDNIPAVITGIETMLDSAYGRECIMYVWPIWGHESADYTGYASYSALLSAFADHVCGHGAALAGNVAAGVRPKVLSYQPNNAITHAAGSVVMSAIDTLHCALTDPDVVCIGPVYHERTVDGGIHMVCKAMTAELMAHVADIVRAGGDFTPLHISAVSRVGNVITATLSGPPGFVIRDDDWLPTLPNGGIAYADDSASATIAAVVIVNTDAWTRSLTITLSAVPTGANKRLIVAGVNNTTDDTHPGGMASFYVAGPRSFWHRKGFERWCTPEIRHYICRDVIAVS